MVAGLVLADPIQAVIRILRADPDVAALCSRNRDPSLDPTMAPRINGSFPESSDPRLRWEMPDYAILVQRSGGPAPDYQTSLRYARMDLRFFGPGATVGVRRRLADQLWRTADPVLCPPAGIGVPAGFHAGGCIVQSIVADADPIADIEPGTDWPLWIVPYTVTYMALQVAA